SVCEGIPSNEARSNERRNEPRKLSLRYAINLLALENSAGAAAFDRIGANNFVSVRQLYRQGHRVAFDRARIDCRPAVRLLTNSSRTRTFALMRPAPTEAAFTIKR